MFGMKSRKQQKRMVRVLTSAVIQNTPKDTMTVLSFSPSHLHGMQSEHMLHATWLVSDEQDKRVTVEVDVTLDEAEKMLAAAGISDTKGSNVYTTHDTTPFNVLPVEPLMNRKYAVLSVQDKTGVSYTTRTTIPRSNSSEHARKMIMVEAEKIRAGRLS